MPDYQTLFFRLFNEIAIPNNRLLRICRDPQSRRLILQQRRALKKAFDQYLTAMQKENQ